jgi:uncharacterized membrane protein YfcA/uncharacterized membrane protein
MKLALVGKARHSAASGSLKQTLKTGKKASNVIQICLLISACILSGGLLLVLVKGQMSSEQLLNFPHSPAQLGSSLFSFQPQAIIALGLLLLIITPLLRVLIELVNFVHKHDKKYLVISSLVLAILLLSLLLGGEHSTTAMPGNLQHVSFSWQSVLWIFVGSILAGFLGSLVGLGGGILIVPMLTIFFGLPIAFASGVSIIAVIATSSGASAAFSREKLANVRIGVFLALATTIGAISGAFLAGLLTPDVLGVLFGIILLISVAPIIFKIKEELPQGIKSDRLAKWLQLGSAYTDPRLGQQVNYEVTHTLPGLAMMFGAGLISGLLGIGSGVFKVIALETIMKLPVKVSTSTSSLMIGFTAAASAAIYFSRGEITPLIAAPVALGILLGAMSGARVLPHLSNRFLRMIFVPVIVITALQMILKGLGIGLF